MTINQTSLADEEFFPLGSLIVLLGKLREGIGVFKDAVVGSGPVDLLHDNTVWVLTQHTAPNT